MNINFATCDRSIALRYIQQVFPSTVVTDTPACASPLLDLVERDIVRVQDPMMYGNTIGVTPSTNWNDSFNDEVIAAGKVLTGFVTASKATGDAS